MIVCFAVCNRLADVVVRKWLGPAIIRNTLAPDEANVKHNGLQNNLGTIQQREHDRSRTAAEPIPLGVHRRHRFHERCCTCRYIVSSMIERA